MVELDGCTFEPKINRSNSPPRDLSAYLKDQKDFEVKKSLKNYALFCQLDEQEKSQRHTSMSKGSRKALLNNKELAERSVENLYRNGVELLNSKSQKILKDPSLNFTPSINKKSKVLSRESSSDLLYREASERKSRKEKRFTEYQVNE